MAKQLIRCDEAGCKNVFPPRFAGQKRGTCPACRAERRRLAALRRKNRGGPPLSQEDNDMLRRLERITVRTPRV